MLGVQKASQVWANLGASLSKSLGCSLLHRVLHAGLCFKEASFAQWHSGSDAFSLCHVGINLKLEQIKPRVTIQMGHCLRSIPATGIVGATFGALSNSPPQAALSSLMGGPIFQDA